MKVYMDGRLIERKDAKVSVFDHGLLYGDGVFEGIRSYNGMVFKLKEHIDRLFASAQRIALEIPFSRQGLSDAIVKTLQANYLNIRDLLGYDYLLIPRDSLEVIQLILGAAGG